MGASPKEDLHNSRSQGRGLELPDCTVRAIKCEVRAGGSLIYPWGVGKQEDLKDDTRMSVILVKCRCIHVKQVKQSIKLKEQKACEGSRYNDDP